MILLSLICHQVMLTLFLNISLFFYVNFSISVPIPLIQSLMFISPDFPASVLFSIYCYHLSLWFYCHLILFLLASPHFLCIGMYDY